MNVKNMPHVTVEQVLKLRKAAINLEHDNAILEAMNSKLENSLERVLNAVEAKKPAVQYDALVAMNAELVEALEGLLWGVDLETTDIPYTCISTANHALAKAKELSQ